MATRRLIRLLGERRGRGGRLVQKSQLTSSGLTYLGEATRDVPTNVLRLALGHFDGSHWFALWHQLRSLEGGQAAELMQ